MSGRHVSVKTGWSWGFPEAEAHERCPGSDERKGGR